MRDQRVPPPPPVGTARAHRDAPSAVLDDERYSLVLFVALQVALTPVERDACERVSSMSSQDGNLCWHNPSGHDQTGTFHREISSLLILKIYMRTLIYK